MSIDMNVVIYAGRLTADPTPLGGDTGGCRFDLASNRVFRNKDSEKVEEATFMPIVCWGQNAKIVLERAKRGTPLIIQGRLSVRRVPQEDGSFRKFTDIVAQTVQFVSMGAAAAPAEDVPMDDVPTEQSAPAAKKEEYAPMNNRNLPPGIDPAAAELLLKLLGTK